MGKEKQTVVTFLYLVTNKKKKNILRGENNGNVIHTCTHIFRAVHELPSTIELNVWLAHIMKKTNSQIRYDMHSGKKKEEEIAGHFFPEKKTKESKFRFRTRERGSLRGAILIVDSLVVVNNDRLIFLFNFFNQVRFDGEHLDRSLSRLAFINTQTHDAFAL